MSGVLRTASANKHGRIIIDENDINQNFQLDIKNLIENIENKTCHVPGKSCDYRRYNEMVPKWII